MLDVPVASRDREDDARTAPERHAHPHGHAPHERETREHGGPHAAPSWRPRLVLVPVWRLDARARLFKRLVDLCLALTVLLLFAVPVLCIMLAIRLDSPGPALFRQPRVGLHGRVFTLLKFRTMRAHAGPPGMLRQATRHDPRVTRTGGWLRRWSLDELPQLINVLRGEMSMVGPRPHASGTRAGGRLFEEVTHSYTTRHCVKPGMTGLAQVRGWRGETDTEEKLLRRIECDLEYIATWSARLDLAILWRTAGSVWNNNDVY